MNDEQIVLSLLNFYKNEGIDMHQILDDPIFVKLSVPSKVAAVKDHAREIREGTSAGVTKRDLSHAGTSALFHGILGGMTGAAASVATAKLFTGGRISPAAILLGAAPGIGLGLGMSALENYGRISGRNKIRGYLDAAHRSQSNDSALGVLAKRQLQTTSQGNAAFNKFINRIESNTDQRSKDLAIQQTIRDNNDAGLKINE